MSRIRTIKPEFWTSEQVVECHPMARLMFIAMWNFCDDGGVHPDSNSRLKMEIFPGDPYTLEQVQEWKEELARNGLIRCYEVDGRRYLHVTGWHHQRIEKPTFKYPGPAKADRFVEYSTTSRRPLADLSAPDVDVDVDVDVESTVMEVNTNTSCSEPPQAASAEQQAETPEQPEPAKVDPVPETSREVESVASQEVLLHNDTVVINIPLAGKRGEFAVTDSMVAEWEEAYPAVDVRQQLREIRQWNISNPTRRKTRSGVRKHICSWLSGRQNNASQHSQSAYFGRPVNGTAKYTKPVTKADFAATDYASGATKPEDDPDWFKNAGRIPH